MTEEQATEQSRRIDTVARCAGLTEVHRRQRQDALLLEAQGSVAKRQEMERRREALIGKSQGDRGRLAARIREMAKKGEL